MSGTNLATSWNLPKSATIAVVGASSRAAAQSVVRSGRRAVAADLFADEDLRRICPATRISPYPAGLVDWLRATPCDGWLYTGALENYPELVDELAALKPLLGNPGSVLKRVRDPLLLQQVLCDHDFPFLETRTSSEGLPCDGSWLAKTYAGSGGIGVDDLSSSTKTRDFFQRKITGEPCSTLYAGGSLLGVTRQLVGESWTGAGPYQYCGTVAPWQLPEEVESQLRDLGKSLVEEFGLKGLFGVDFVFDGHRPWAIEVNPRYTASTEVIEHTAVTNAIDWHVVSHHRNPIEPSPSLSNGSTYHGKAVLFARLSSMVTDDFTHWALAQPDLADIPSAGTSLSPGQPVLSVRAEAESIPLILRALKSRMGQVDIRLWGGAEACDWVS